MGGYLGRVVTRTAVVPGFQPQVRSASPIAQDDQRLGMPGFEEAPLASPLTDDGLEHWILTDSPPASAPRPPARIGRSEGVIQRAARASATMAAPPRNSTIDRELRPGFPTETREVVPPLQDQQPSSAALPEIQPAPPQTRAMPAQDFQPQAPPRVDIGSSAEAQYESSPGRSRDSVDDVETPLLEPARRQVPAASADTSTGEEAAPETAEDREPRIVIGRINVEVIPATPEPAKAEAVRPKPLTAAAASVIGPLSNGVRSGRLLSLRYR